MRSAELADTVNRLAHHLLRSGVDPGRRVVSCVPRGVDAIVVRAAIMAAGAVPVPVDPGSPAEVLGELLARTAPAVIIGSAAAVAACRAALPRKSFGGIALDCPRTRMAIATSPATPFSGAAT
ncbi:MAG TPA: AMP-binding protein [Actinophytocola sp.]|uniref:AMP-binding protein n=1 Tax=Actinophytocola sp. TaxID=1872138 RepID=UPI002DDD0383|nr:AMP-binding protein [Actinophytocola sp.]HEV2780406.1 AMP-binding protein [Actinophytocola sp.]